MSFSSSSSLSLSLSLSLLLPLLLLSLLLLSSALRFFEAEATTAALAAGFGQLAMTEGFRFLSVTAGSAFQMTLPLIISLGGVVFFAEHFTALQIVGGLLILAGSYQVVVKSGK